MRKINNILWLGLGSLLAYNIASSDAKTIDDYVNCFKKEKSQATSSPEFKPDGSVIDYVKGDIIVGFKKDKVTERDVKEFLTKIGYQVKSELLDKVYVIKVPEGEEIKSAEVLKNSKCLSEIVRYAQLNRILRVYR